MRKLLFALALLLGVGFFITRIAEMQTIAETLRRGDWRFIGLAVFIQTLWLLNLAGIFQRIYSLLGIDVSRRQALRLSTAAFLMTVIAPSGGMSGVAVFVADARRRRYSPARAMVSGALHVFFDYSAFLIVLAMGLVVLFRRHHLGWPEILASLVLVGIAAGLAALLILAMRSGNQLSRLLAGAAGLANRVLRPFLRREVVSVLKAHHFAHDLSSGATVLRSQPRRLGTPLAMALLAKALLITVLLLMFLAFRVPIDVGTLIAGYSMANLFVIVSPTPSGIGMVEGMLTLALTTLGVSLEAAAVVTLAYRGITFWYPLLVGVLSMRAIRQAQPDEDPRLPQMPPPED